MTQVVDLSTEPTTSSAIAERIGSNLNLIHAQILEAIAEQRKKLDEFETVTREAMERAKGSIGKACEISSQVHTLIKSNDLVLGELRSILAKEVS